MPPENEAPTAGEIDITVLIACYNEAPFIVDALNNVTGALRESGRTHEVIVIDDASADDSRRLIADYIRAHPELPIRLKVNEKNRGLANNFVDAAFLGRGKYYRLCHGDDCEPKASLAKTFGHIGQADLVIPYEKAMEMAGRTWQRKLLSQAFTSIVNLLGGYRIKYYNGMAIYLRYHVLRWHPSSYGFGFQADMVTHLLDEGVTYMQVHRFTVERKGESSSALSLRNALSILHTLLEIAIRRFRRFLYGKSMPQPREIQPPD